MGSGIEVTAELSTEGTDAANYASNTSAGDTASISPKSLEIGLAAEDKVYDGTADAITSAFIADGLVEGDDVSVSSGGGMFASSDAGNDIDVFASVSSWELMQEITSRMSATDQLILHPDPLL